MRLLSAAELSLNSRIALGVTTLTEVPTTTTQLMSMQLQASVETAPSTAPQIAGTGVSAQQSIKLHKKGKPNEADLLAFFGRTRLVTQ